MKTSRPTTETSRCVQDRPVKKAASAPTLEQLKAGAIKSGIRAGHAGYCCGCRIRG